LTTLGEKLTNEEVEDMLKVRIVFISSSWVSAVTDNGWVGLSRKPTPTETVSSTTRRYDINTILSHSF
jgi:hypothetical protein